MNTNSSRITFRSILIGAVLSGVFAVLTHVLDNRFGVCVAANQIPLFPYILLMLIALLINPLCRLLRLVKRFSRADILVIFVMCMVSSGIGSFGLIGEWVPLMGSLFNRHWNNDQSEWNIYVEPFLNEHFFVSEPGMRKAAKAYREAVFEARDLKAVYNAALRQSGETEVAGENGAESGIPEGLSAEGVLGTYPKKMAEQDAIVKNRREALSVLEEAAFAKIETFRRGLPRGLRAFPGILPVLQQDNAATYFGRLQRLFHGKRSVYDLLSGDGDTSRRILRNRYLEGAAFDEEYPGFLSPDPAQRTFERQQIPTSQLISVPERHRMTTA